MMYRPKKDGYKRGIDEQKIIEQKTYIGRKKREGKKE